MKKIYKKYHEMIMYLLFGVITTIVAWVSYAIFTRIIPVFTFCGITVDHTTSANILSWICCVIFAFVTNKIWVFNSKSWKPSLAVKEFGLFVSSRLITGVIEWVGLPLLISIGTNLAENGAQGFFAKIFITISMPMFGTDGMIAKITMSVIVVILNFVFSKLIIFKRKKTIGEMTSDEKKQTEEIIDEIMDDIHNK